MNFPRGAIIIETGNEPDECFYAISSGTVRLSSRSDMYLLNGRRVLGNGDLFSVESTLARERGHITAIAETEVTLMAITKKQFPLFIEQHPPLSTRIVRQLSLHLRYLGEHFSRDETPLPASGISRLYGFGEYYLKRNLFRSAYCAFRQYLKYCPKGENVEKAIKYVNKYASYAAGIEFDHDDKDITRVYPIDSVIFFEHEPGDGLYMIRKGAVKMTRIDGNKETVLAMLKTGDIVGETGLVDTVPRTANAIAREDCELTAIAHTAYLPILKDGINITEKICIMLSERIYDVYDKVNDKINRDCRS
ncbi:MAG: cyclic nucleotide-binding domain-containing protein [Spirochaetaceae bacterium]|jgi:CRP-like cAMP-binding protein|nr:cyclic nucleotide-binding domain-containing protein [Spirochaetaceae bacterium]